MPGPGKEVVLALLDSDRSAERWAALGDSDASTLIPADQEACLAQARAGGVGAVLVLPQAAATRALERLRADPVAARVPVVLLGSRDPDDAELELMSECTATVPGWLATAKIWRLLDAFLDRRRREAAAAGRAHLKLLEGAIHDLNNPLTNLAGSSDLVLAQLEASGVADERILRRLRTMGCSAADMTALLRVLRDHVLLTSGGRHSTIRTEGALDLIERARERLHATTGSAELVQVPAGASDARVSVDPSLAVEALHCLMRHGLKRVGGTGVIEVDVRATGEHASILLADRGPTLSEELQAAFARDRSNGAECPDLRLAFSRAAVERMGGEIRAEPREGGGTCFHVVLPLQRG